MQLWEQQRQQVRKMTTNDTNSNTNSNSSSPRPQSASCHSAQGLLLLLLMLAVDKGPQQHSHWQQRCSQTRSSRPRWRPVPHKQQQQQRHLRRWAQEQVPHSLLVVFKSQL